MLAVEQVRVHGRGGWLLIGVRAVQIGEADRTAVDAEPGEEGEGHDVTDALDRQGLQHPQRRGHVEVQEARLHAYDGAQGADPADQGVHRRGMTRVAGADIIFTEFEGAAAERLAVAQGGGDQLVLGLRELRCGDGRGAAMRALLLGAGAVGARVARQLVEQPGVRRVAVAGGSS